MNKEDLITAVRSVLERHPYILRVELFGSQQREEATSASDVDLLKEVLKQTGLGRSSLYEKMKTGDFPRQVKLGPKASAWPESAVQNWIADRVGLTDSNSKPSQA